MTIRRVAWRPHRPRTAPSLCTALGLALGVATAPAALAGPPGQPAPIVVALDPGHGGTNLGASGVAPGVYEKNVTLALAERVRALLEASSQDQEVRDQDQDRHLPQDRASPRVRFQVVLCRTGDQLVPIRARARCAAESSARLFLSLHTNAVPAGVTPGAQHGFEVFVLGPREIDDDAALAALSAPDAAEAAWQAHVVRAAGQRAISLARVVDEALAHQLGPGARRGVKQAGAALDVLRGAGTPAALVEVGFLDDPEEGARLASASGREPIARALATAVRAFVRQDPGADPPGPSARRLPSIARPAAPSSPVQARARLQTEDDATSRPLAPPAAAVR